MRVLREVVLYSDGSDGDGGVQNAQMRVRRGRVDGGGRR